MRILVHKTQPQLALLFTPQEWQTNQHRAPEWLQTLQHNPAYMAELQAEGVVGVNAGPHGQEVVILIDFLSLDHIREFMLDRREYTQEQFIRLCQENGKDPNTYLQRAQGAQQVFFF